MLSSLSSLSFLSLHPFPAPSVLPPLGLLCLLQLTSLKRAAMALCDQLVQRHCFTDEDTESQGHHVTCPKFLRCPRSGPWVRVHCPFHQSAYPVPSRVPQDRQGGFGDTWFGTFSGQTDLPCSHRRSHFVMPFYLGSGLAMFASLQISLFAEFRAGLQGLGPGSCCDGHQGAP